MVEYRKAGKSDIEALVDMRVKYIREDQGSISEKDEEFMVEQLPVYFNKHLNKDLIAFIAKDKGKTVATVLLLVIEKPSNPHFLHGKIGELLNVYTLPNYRHQGVASRLLEDLITYSKTAKLDFLELSATKDGYELYKKIGFCDHCSEYRSMRMKL